MDLGLAELIDIVGAGRTFGAVVSVRETSALEQFAENVTERFDGCDMLINNAGQGRVAAPSASYVTGAQFEVSGGLSRFI